MVWEGGGHLSKVSEECEAGGRVMWLSHRNHIEKRRVCFIEHLLIASRMLMSFACIALSAMDKQMGKYLG